MAPAWVYKRAGATAASRAPACLHQPYAHFADDASRKAEARLAGAEGRAVAQVLFSLVGFVGFVGFGFRVQ